MKNLKDYILNENNFFKNLGVGKVQLIKDFCDKYTKYGYTINKDETINATIVDLRGYPETELHGIFNSMWLIECRLRVVN